MRAKNEPGSHISCSWECKKVREWTPHSQVSPILGVGVPMGFRIFRGQLQGSKLIGLRSYLYYSKFLGTQMSKMGSHDPFGYLKHKLWPKEGPGVKLPIWLSTIKSREASWFPYVQVACDIPLESSWQELQLCLRPHLNQKSVDKIMGLQNCKNPNFENFGIPTWESWDKITFGCWSCGQAQSIL
jgi:hypothetical protein